MNITTRIQILESMFTLEPHIHEGPALFGCETYQCNINLSLWLGSNIFFNYNYFNYNLFLN